MNKNSFRLVYSRLRGMVVAVQETATATGKSHSGESVAHAQARTGAGVLLFSWRSIAFAAALLTGTAPLSVDAQIVPGGAHAPSVIQTQNGIQQVNVNRPSGAGVSMNTYGQFDVPKAGAILNNSPVIVSTQQAGLVNGNPNFGAGQSAKIIVNQVNSNNPSQLRGYVEVAGTRAEVVIANSAGLVVNGGGFINTSRAILTTGAPTFGTNGALTGFDVTGGRITVEGAGLNASNIDQVDLIARAVQANAAIYANTLNVVAGANHVDHDTLAANPITGTDTAPSIAIDVSALGGMYANRIYLASNEYGVGVSNAGVLAAQAGDLTLAANGRLSLTGKTNSSGNMSLSATGGVQNDGTTYATQGMTVNTAADITNTGTLAAQQNTNVNAGSVSSTGTLSAGTNSDGSIAKSGDLTVTSSGALSATGQNAAGGSTSLQGASVNLAGSQTSANNNLTLTAKAGDLNLTGATASTQGVLSATAAGTLTNDKGTLSSQGGSTLSAANVSNQDGTVVTQGALAVTTSGALTNDDGTLSSQQAINLQTGSISNQGGSVVSTNATQIETGALKNTQGTIQGGGALNVNASSIDNTAGRLVSLNSDGLSVSATGQLTNATGTTSNGAQGGVIGGNGNSSVSASTLVNSGSITAKNALDVSGTSSIDNSNGTISATQLDLSAGSLTNHAGLIAQTGTVDQTMQVTSSFDNSSGTTQSNATNLTVNAGSLSNDGGTVFHGGSGTLQVTDAGALSNRNGGSLGTNGTLSAQASSFDNTGGVVGAKSGSATLASRSTLVNDQGVIEGQNGLNVSAAGALSNQSGKLESLASTGTMNVSGQSINNANGQIINAGTGATQITAGSITNANTSGQGSAGMIGGNGDVTLSVASIQNGASSQIIAGHDLALKTVGQLVNSGSLTAGATLSLDEGSATVSNANGAISAANIDLDTASLDNTNGTVGNPAGSTGNVSIQTGTLTNTGGTIASTQDVKVGASALVGNGKLIGGRDTAVNLQGNYTNAAANLITANRNLTFTTTGQLTNAGTMNSAGNLTVNASGIVNQAGATLASGNPGDVTNGATTLNAGSGDIVNGGSIDGNAVTTTSNTLTNTGAIIGGTLTHTASTITNDGARAVIAGTGQVNLYSANTFTNQNGATVVSLGDVNIARNGQKDANGNLINQTGTVNNLSSTIEADGALNIAASQLNNVRQNVQTQTSTTSSTSTMSELPWWHAGQPGNTAPFQDANTDIKQAYYVNPADIVSITPVITPDGYVVQKIVVNLPANVSAFQWSESGLAHGQPDGGTQIEYQQDSRLTPGAGQVTLYAYNVQAAQSNPDQAGGTAWSQFSKTTTPNQLGTTSYSNQYGDCTTACTRIETYPQYNDPTTQIQKDTEQRRAGSGQGSYPTEVERIANETISRTTLSPASGAPALLTSGGAMNLTIGTQLNNDNGTIAAGGNLNVNNQAVPTGGSNAVIKNTSTQLSTTYSFQNQSGYSSPWTGDPNVASQWTTWTNPSITTSDGIAGGTITSNQTVSINAGNISNTSVTATAGPTGASAAALGLTGATFGTGQLVGALGAIQTVGGARTSTPNLKLPTSGLFTVNAAPNQPYLIATDPRFTSYTNFTSSDYMLSQLGLNPGSVEKRLGDGYYESQLVMDQVTNLTGKRYLAGYTSNEAEYQQLMTNGATFAKQFGMEPGVALTDAQMAALTTDIVWLVNQTVTLPDGSVQTVLVPQVYLAKSDTMDLTPTGALIAGDAVGLKGNDIVNQGGTIAGTNNTVLLASNDIQNLGGAITGGNLALVAGRDIVNQSVTDTETAHFAMGTSTHTSIGALGTIQSTGNLQLLAGHDLTVNGASIDAGGTLGVTAGHAINLGTVSTGSDVATQTDARNTREVTSLTQVGSTLQAGGSLGLVSAGDINVTGSTVQSGGNMLVAGAGNVTIQNATNSTTFNSADAHDKDWGHVAQASQSSVGSSLSAGGSATVLAGAQADQNGNIVLPANAPADAPSNNLTIQGSSVIAGTNGAGKGAVQLGATGDVNLVEDYTRTSGSDAGHAESHGFLSHSSTDTARQYAGNNANGSLVSGDSVTVVAGQDLNVHGSSVVGTNDVALKAGGNVDIAAAQNTAQDSSYYDHKKSGLFGSGGLGFTIGSTEQKALSDNNAITESQSRSTVGSVQGNVSISAGQNAHIGGSDIVAGKSANDVSGKTGNIAIQAQNITIDPGQDAATSHDQQEARSSGLTVAVTGTPLDTVRNLRDDASSGNGFHRAQGVLNELGASAADTPSISVSYGRSESSSTTDTSSLANAGSTIRGGGNVSVTATGGAARVRGAPVDGDITVTGSTISAGGTTTLAANRNVILQASTDQFAQSTQSSSSSTGISLASPSLGDLGRWIGGTANNGGTSPSPYNASRSNSDGTQTQTTQTATVVSGNSVVVKSTTGDIDVIGSGISGTQGVDLIASQGAINVLAGLDTSTNHQESSAHQIGSLGSNGTATGFSVGVANSHSVQDTASQTQSTMRSQIVSGNGNVTLDANRDVTVQGSDLSAGKDLTLIGQNLNLDPGTDATQNHSAQSSGQFGVSLALGGAVGNAVATVNQSMDHAAQAGDARLAALDKAQAGLAVYNAYQVASATSPTGPTSQPLIKATISVGGGSSHSESQSSTLANEGSTLKAGGTATLVATGSGTTDANGVATDGDINARGTQISASNVTLNAAHDINLQSARDTDQQSGSNSSSGGSIGIGAALGGQQNGFTLELAANTSHGNSNGQSVTHRDTQIAASNTLSITSGRDTNLQGAEVSGQTIDANVGRNLTIQSPQDTSTYDSKQSSAGFQASICVPPFCFGQTVSGSASVSQQKIDSNYQSVNQQSGMYAGDGGFNVNVGNHTQLDGGVIASTAGADKNTLSTQTLGYTDLQNHADYSGSTIGFSASGGAGKSTANGVGFTTPVQTGSSTPGPLNSQGLGPTGFGAAGTSSSASGTTYAAVSPGTITVRGDAGTGHDSTAGLSRDTVNANGSVQNTFDAQKVSNDMAVQQGVVQVGMQVVGDVATALKDKADVALDKASKAYDTAKANGDTAGMAQAQADITAAQQQTLWSNDGAARVGSHAAVAALGAALGGGNVAGAVGGTVAGDVAGNAASDALGNTLGGNVLSNVVAGAAGAAAGGALGGKTRPRCRLVWTCRHWARRQSDARPLPCSSSPCR